MKTITLTPEEFEQQRSFCYNDDSVFEAHLKQQIQNYSVCKDHNVKCYERFTKAELMLSKLEFEKYNINSIEIEGKGVDRFICYIEFKDGTPLNEKQMDDLLDNSKLHENLILAKLL